MGQWVEEKPTMELRWAKRDIQINDEVAMTTSILQQLWKITRGGLGRVEYAEEWRDVPNVEENKK